MTAWFLRKKLNMLDHMELSSHLPPRAMWAETDGYSVINLSELNAWLPDVHESYDNAQLYFIDPWGMVETKTVRISQLENSVNFFDGHGGSKFIREHQLVSMRLEWKDEWVDFGIILNDWEVIKVN